MGNAAECAKGNHDFIPIGHEHQNLQDDPKAGIEQDGPVTRWPKMTTHWYVIRACANCTAVWWQEYDPEMAMKLRA